eukprot:14190548-Ditylum_brightwellii.AAC.1
MSMPKRTSSFWSAKSSRRMGGVVCDGAGCDIIGIHELILEPFFLEGGAAEVVRADHVDGFTAFAFAAFTVDWEHQESVEAK